MKPTDGFVGGDRGTRCDWVWVDDYGQWKRCQLSWPHQGLHVDNRPVEDMPDDPRLDNPNRPYRPEP